MGIIFIMRNMGDLLVHHAQNDIQIRLLKTAGVQANLTMYELAKILV